MSCSPRKSDRGATLPEYSLLIALFILAVIGGLQALQDGAQDEFAAQKVDISDTGPTGTIAPTSTTAATVPGPTTTSTTTTTTAPTTSTTGSTTSTTQPYSGTVGRVCNGNQCTFSISPTPPTNPVWSIFPGLSSSNGASGTLPGPITFTKEETFVVTAKVGTTNFTRTVVCDKQQSSVSCS